MSEINLPSAKQVASLRKKLDISQSALAGKLGVSQSLISMWERGVAIPADDQSRQIGSMLNSGVKADGSVTSDRVAGEKIRERRLSNGLSQKELADKLGVSQPLVSQWESARTRPTQEQIDLLESILGGITSADGTAPSDSESALAAWLSKIRLTRKLTVNELATKAGVSAATIYNIETGRAENPHRKTILKLEAALGSKLESEEEVSQANQIEGLGGLVDFDPYDTENLPDAAGVYVFYDISQRPIYVGQGISISRRIREHHEKFWFKKPIVDDGAYIEISDKRIREQIEKILIRFLKQNAVLNKNNVDRD